MPKTGSTEATQKVAEKLATRILETPHDGAVVLALVGDLGAGKTTFTQGFANALGIKEKVNSPSFLILKRYPIPDTKYSNFYHIDAYRLNFSKELLDLGFADLLKDPKNIIVIEWADKVQDILPPDTIFIEFFHGKIENERELNVTDRGSAYEAEYRQ